MASVTNERVLRGSVGSPHISPQAVRVMKSCQGIAKAPAFCSERSTCSTPSTLLRLASPASKLTPAGADGRADEVVEEAARCR